MGKSSSRPVEKKFLGKTILVCGNRVVKVFDGPADPVEINEEAKNMSEELVLYLPA